ncbi:hypothetical protein KV097_15685 [Mumia sp. zg.B17]|uniref:hypothetical protein n=1 Tax=Mumia sp. zg.B17 TaxID=2855446 RepID=UPI001C6F2983|nr:hypothetical protein [Mumia sp. zg.B17]MBW9207384.1 hypothetical protein [Mumia sp. zg.B17]
MAAHSASAPAIPISLEEVDPLPRASYTRLAGVWIRQGGEAVGVDALETPATILIVKADATSFDGEAAIKQGRIEVRPIGVKGSVEKIASPPGRRPRQINGSDLNTRYVVWTEIESVDLGVSPWVLFAYDRKTGMTRKLTEAPKVDGRTPPPPPGYTGPVVAGGRVFWAQVGGKFGAEAVDIWGCEIGNCLPKVVMRGAAFPAVTSTELYGVRSARYEGVRDSRRITSATISKVRFGGGEPAAVKQVPLGEQDTFTGFAASDAGLAWIVGRKKSPEEQRMYLTVTEDGNETTFGSSANGGFGYPVMTDRFVAWAETSGNAPGELGGYLYDLESKKLNSIGNTLGLYGIEGGGDLLGWQESETPQARPEDIEYVIVRLR